MFPIGWNVSNLWEGGGKNPGKGAIYCAHTGRGGRFTIIEGDLKVNRCFVSKAEGSFLILLSS
jgi:hypothetical protein